MPPNSGPQLPGFKNEFELADHFRRHSKDFKGYYKDYSEYLSGAHDVIKHGIEVEYRYNPSGSSIDELRKGFIKVMGPSSKRGHSKFEFVGTNHKGEITTYHVKSGKEFWKTLNGNPRDKIVRPFEYGAEAEHIFRPRF